MTTHILNGDALKDQFPAEIEGKVIIMREALVDGPLRAKTLSDFFDLRSKFVLGSYGPHEHEYHDFVVPEFNKIREISNDEQVFLWFEDDLFCQINMWFCIHLLLASGLTNNISWVRPQEQLEYGFAAYKPDSLPTLIDKAIVLEHDDLKLLERLWKSVQIDDMGQLKALADKLPSNLLVIGDAIQARSDQKAGVPEDMIRDIISETDAKSFGPVFQQFHKKGAIYGFGDLQVKRIYDQIIDSSDS